MINSADLAARFEPFDSYWEGPQNIEKGYSSLGAFYTDNYLSHFPDDKNANILVISCGPGYMLNVLELNGYTNVLGIDSEPEKVELAKARGFNCSVDHAFEHLQAAGANEFDTIFCEQELNHLTKAEIMDFLALALDKLKPGGAIIGHGLNGANPITGAEALAQNFDHFNTFTEYTFDQILAHSGYSDITVFPLNLYVFWKNPANYILLGFTKVLYAYFRIMFIIHGKHNKMWTKKIGAIGFKPL